MSQLPPLALTGSCEREMDIIRQRIVKQDVTGKPLQILEAGCGQRWGIDLKDIPYHLTGVDLDQVALDMRKHQSRDLHETIWGDLNTVQLPAAHYDVVYSSFVLEHIANAEGVLENFTRWCKPGGLIIIRVPDPHSVGGFITRVTPHWFHIFFYRFILDSPNAGKPGHAPYPVHYGSVISRQGMRLFCQKHCLTLEDEYGDGWYRPGAGLKGKLVHAVKRVVGALSLGSLSVTHHNLLFVLRN